MIQYDGSDLIARVLMACEKSYPCFDLARFSLVLVLVDVDHRLCPFVMFRRQASNVCARTGCDYEDLYGVYYRWIRTLMDAQTNDDPEQEPKPNHHHRKMSRYSVKDDRVDQGNYSETWCKGIGSHHRAAQPSQILPQ